MGHSIQQSCRCGATHDTLIVVEIIPANFIQVWTADCELQIVEVNCKVEIIDVGEIFPRYKTRMNTVSHSIRQQVHIGITRAIPFLALTNQGFLIDSHPKLNGCRHKHKNVEPEIVFIGSSQVKVETS